MPPEKDGASPDLTDEWKEEISLFYRANYRALRRTARFMGASRDDAEDVVQHALLALAQAWGGVGDPLPYANRVMFTHLVRLRERGPEAERARQVKHGVAHREISLDDTARWDDEQWVLQMLMSLPEAQRAALALTFDDLGSEAIGKLLGKKPATVRKNLQDAREKLRRHPEVINKIDASPFKTVNIPGREQP